MHDPKTLWRLARMHESRSFLPWTSAARDSATALEKFKDWLNSLPVSKASPCFIITGPHIARTTIWEDALIWMLSAFPESGEIYVLDDDLRTVLTLNSMGIARFTAGV
ncbi:hypothetical protein [Prosthecobacter sp.]|uniref:hypothetical protein n=1 Tax=Prosthecobacter sp. TaxID=1965333 RepID=UPI0026166E35|nr:hypothetical protein [Prosthecobacter sp.]